MDRWHVTLALALLACVALVVAVESKRLERVAFWVYMASALTAILIPAVTAAEALADAFERWVR